MQQNDDSDVQLHVRDDKDPCKIVRNSWKVHFTCDCKMCVHYRPVAGTILYCMVTVVYVGLITAET